jgi:DNA-binding LytR/AlgR family response regulator
MEQVNSGVFMITIGIGDDRNNKGIVFETVSGNIKVEIEDIFYVVARKNYATVHLKDRAIQVYSSLKNIEEQCSGLLLHRIHRSILVNVLHVEDIAHRLAKLESGISLPIGRIYYKAFMEAYHSFLHKYAI